MNPADTDPGDDPGTSVVYDLAADCTLSDTSEGERYRAVVNGVVDYGVFVDLSDSVSGLVHESNLATDYDVDDTLTVELIEVRENGDLSFTPVDVDDAEIVAVAHEYEVAETEKLAEQVGDTVHLEGEIVQIKQTGGPTIFHVSDHTGVVPCAAFEEAGVRAHPEIDIEDIVHLVGVVEEREGSLQVEVTSLTALEGDEEDVVRERIETALDERAEPHETEPLIDWPALEQLFPDLREIAKQLRRTVLRKPPDTSPSPRGRRRHVCQPPGRTRAEAVHRGDPPGTRGKAPPVQAPAEQGTVLRDGGRNP